MNELISVIVPVYNAEKHIRHCIDSILTQTYQNFELILVNDGSKDNSLELCKAYEKQDGRIRVFDRENGGASAARNTGLDNMKGTYVLFVDSDDYISQNCLENLYKAAKLRDYDIVQCKISRTDEVLKDSICVPFQDLDVTEITKIKALNYRMYMVSACGKIYASRIFKNFRFKEGIIYEDEASYYILVDHSERIAILNETLYYYFMSDNSIMRNDNSVKNMDFIEIYEDRIKYFSDKNDEVLLGGSYFRYCTILMFAIADVLTTKYVNADLEKLIALYKFHYAIARKSKYVRKKDKMLLFVFRRAPKLLGRLIGKLRKKC